MEKWETLTQLENVQLLIDITPVPNTCKQLPVKLTKVISFKMVPGDTRAKSELTKDWIITPLPFIVTFDKVGKLLPTNMSSILVNVMIMTEEEISIRSNPGDAFASSTACRKEPTPVSFPLETVNVAAFKLPKEMRLQIRNRRKI